LRIVASEVKRRSAALRVSAKGADSGEILARPRRAFSGRGQNRSPNLRSMSSKSTDSRAHPFPFNGGRIWWAHFEFTRLFGAARRGRRVSGFAQVAQNLPRNRLLGPTLPDSPAGKGPGDCCEREPVSGATRASDGKPPRRAESAAGHGPAARCTHLPKRGFPAPSNGSRKQ
jgi:hypothetical protein